jgi:hypothetical protein
MECCPVDLCHLVLEISVEGAERGIVADVNWVDLEISSVSVSNIKKPSCIYLLHAGV